MPSIPPEWRRYLYLVTAAVLPILVAYDVVSEETAPLWANLAAAVLGTSAAALAAANVPRGGSDE